MKNSCCIPSGSFTLSWRKSFIHTYALTTTFFFHNVIVIFIPPKTKEFRILIRFSKQVTDSKKRQNGDLFCKKFLFIRRSSLTLINCPARESGKSFIPAIDCATVISRTGSDMNGLARYYANDCRG